jgi:hypothetical protein
LPPVEAWKDMPDSLFACRLHRCQNATAIEK